MSSPSSFSFEEWCNQHTSFCLKELLTYKCWEYSGYHPLSLHELKCESAARTLINAAEIEVEPRYGYPVIFSQTLPLILSTFRVGIAYMENLKSDTQRALDSGKSFSLWDFTLEFTQGNRVQALQILAALFQDNTQDRMYTEFFTQSASVKNIESLYDYFGFEILQDTSSKQHQLIRVYPSLSVSTESLHQNFYHFYTAAFLAARLHARKYSPKLAAFVSFLFQAQYEFSEIPESSWPKTDPDSTLDPRKYDWKLRDLYQSYLGAYFGVALHSQVLSFEHFKQRIVKNPKAFLQSLYEQSR